MFHPRLGCSSISFRHQDLPTALRTIEDLTFAEIDLGALPGVCDHVPFVLDAAAVREVAAVVRASGLTVRSVNGDVGDLNLPLDPAGSAARSAHLDRLLELAAAVGARALVLPCGALARDPAGPLGADLDAVAGQLAAAAQRGEAFGVQLWTESLHFHRLCWNLERAAMLADRLAGTGVGHVMDFSHIVASGADPRDFVRLIGSNIRHVHLRDAVPGNINLSIGNGAVDFPAGLRALADAGYAGHFSMELETRDLSHEERPAAAAKAASFVTDFI
ncbi:sugar phosphate isomerase/epimerase [Paenarthrobacter sp. DKR-5]|uniref:sugar phosphate isomerase/epimerase family protein n=1 Tax=Paenarthrobacter sp. DKR-5 TaxID=2835535 RepID=UPI001BDCD542|nr:sugar phosphate isomerase/epimerase [Paenarthrobacter sp. DKR-5]MBT1004121.1 sugar phosphate isomerase/epimerase [Paenarthrobacter sp. DKR-5]